MTAATWAEALTVGCPHRWCAGTKGAPCTSRRHTPAARPHWRRVWLAQAIAAHLDPALDGLGLGPTSNCLLCGTGLPQRHRMVDAIAERLAAGDTEDELAYDYELPVAAIETVREWAAKWPEAWS